MNRFFVLTKKHIDLLFLSLGLSLTSVLSFIHLGNKNLYLDEVAAFTTTRNWTDMLNILKNSEGNMWLYYFFLHFWTKLGTNEFTLRSLSVFFSIATIIPFFYLGKSILGNRVARISMILLPINVFFIKNAQNARSYSLLILLTTISSYLFLCYIHTLKKRYLWIYTIVSALGVYTHLYYLFVIASQLLSLVFLENKKSWKYFAVVYPLIFVLTLPLFLSPSIHSSQINWIMKPSLINLAGIFIILSGDFLPISLISGLLIIWYFFTGWCHGKFKSGINDWNLKFIIISLLFPVIASFVFSLAVKPILVLQYFVICLVPFVLLLSVALGKIQRSILFKTLLILLVGFSIVRLYGWYSGDKRLALTIPNNAEEWKVAAQFVSNNAQDNDVYFVLPTFSQQCFNYYYNQELSAINITELKLEKNHSIAAQSNNGSSPLQTIPEKYPRVWYISNDIVSTEYDKMKFEVKKLLNDNYKLTKQKNFFRLTLYLYENKKK